MSEFGTNLKTCPANNGPTRPGDRHRPQNLSRTSSVKARNLPNNSIGERIMSYVDDAAEDFTGQFNVEVHCKNGMIKDVYINTRKKI